LYLFKLFFGQNRKIFSPKKNSKKIRIFRGPKIFEIFWGSKIDQKSVKKWPKKWPKNDPKIDQKSAKNGRFLTKKWPFLGQKSGFFSRFFGLAGRQLAIFSDFFHAYNDWKMKKKWKKREKWPFFDHFFAIFSRFFCNCASRKSAKIRILHTSGGRKIHLLRGPRQRALFSDFFRKNFRKKIRIFENFPDPKNFRIFFEKKKIGIFGGQKSTKKSRKKSRKKTRKKSIFFAPRKIRIFGPDKNPEKIGIFRGQKKMWKKSKIFDGHFFFKNEKKFLAGKFFFGHFFFPL